MNVNLTQELHLYLFEQWASSIMKCRTSEYLAGLCSEVQLCVLPKMPAVMQYVYCCYGFVPTSAESVCDEWLQCFECFEPLTVLSRGEGWGCRGCMCACVQILNVVIID